MSKIKLSIITINWNNANGLKDTILSIIPQLDNQVQYIVIDGMSTDGSVDVIKEYKDKITFWVSEPNKGIYGNMNRGIAEAKGEYCLFMNSGDRLADNILSEALTQCTGEDIVYFDTYLSYDNRRFEVLRYSPNLTLRNFYRATIGHQSTFIKTVLFSKYGLYNEHNKVLSDYEFWIKTIILENATCKHSPLLLTYYDMGGRSSKKSKELLNEENAIIEKHIPSRILRDYEFWHEKKSEMQILNWYRNQRILYGILVYIYKLIKRLKMH